MTKDKVEKCPRCGSKELREVNRVDGKKYVCQNCYMRF